MQTIVVAALGLIILIILIMLVTKQTGTFYKTVNDCESKGGSCSDSCTGDTRAIGTCPNDRMCCADDETLSERLGFNE